MKLNKVIILLTFIAFLCNTLFGQTDQCEENLELAEKMYEEGNLEGISDLLTPCIEDGFTIPYKARAYKLLTLVSIYEDEREESVSNMTNFLTLDPEYRISSTDEHEFVKLYDEFRTEPIFSLGIVAGGNWTDANILSNGRYGVHTLDEKNDAYSPAGLAFQFGFKFSKHLNKHFVLDLDLMYQQKKYEYRETFFAETNFKGESFSFTDLSVIETQNWIMLPIKLAYDIKPEKNISPFVSGGITIGYMPQMNTLLVRDYNSNSSSSHADVETNTDDLRDHRLVFNSWTFAEAGFHFNIPRGTISVSGRYSMGLLNQLKANSRYSDHQFSYEFFYVEDDLRLNNVQILFSYVYKIYKPILRKKK